jgi:hypothetical protein
MTTSTLTMLFLEFMLKFSKKNFKNKNFMKEIKENFENI